MAAFVEAPHGRPWVLPALAFVLALVTLGSAAAKSVPASAPPSPSHTSGPCGPDCDSCLESTITTPGGVAIHSAECTDPAPPETEPNPNAVSPNWIPVVERHEPTVAPGACASTLPPGYMVMTAIGQPCGPSCANCTSQSTTRNGTSVTFYSCADPPTMHTPPVPGVPQASAPSDALSPTAASFPHGAPSLHGAHPANRSSGSTEAMKCNTQVGEYYDAAHDVCVGYSGAEWTHNGWPCNIIWRAWDFCDENSCRSNTVVVYDEATNRCPSGTGNYLTVQAKFGGAYKGWGDRDRFIRAANSIKDGQCGTFNTWSQGWYTPARVWIRDYNTNAWMNMDFSTVCLNKRASLQPPADILEDLVSDLKWEAIAALKLVSVI